MNVASPSFHDVVVLPSTVSATAPAQRDHDLVVVVRRPGRFGERRVGRDLRHAHARVVDQRGAVEAWPRGGRPRGRRGVALQLDDDRLQLAFADVLAGVLAGADVDGLAGLPDEILGLAVGASEPRRRVAERHGDVVGVVVQGVLLAGRHARRAGPGRERCRSVRCIAWDTSSRDPARTPARRTPRPSTPQSRVGSSRTLLVLGKSTIGNGARLWSSLAWTSSATPCSRRSSAA